MMEIDSRRTVFVTDWFSVVEKRLPDRRLASYFALELTDYVNVVAVTENSDLIVVRQYRPAVECHTLELPSGHVDQGESPIEAAARELLEETGYCSDKFEQLGVLRPDTGRLTNRLWCFFARVSPSSQSCYKEPGIEVLEIQSSSVLESIVDGRPIVDHALCITAVLLAFMQGKL
jgi:ADP-ribose pyrophosphatase